MVYIIDLDNENQFDFHVNNLNFTLFLIHLVFSSIFKLIINFYFN